MDIWVALIMASTVTCSLAFESLAKGGSSSSGVAIDLKSLLAFKKSISHDPFHVLGDWKHSSPYNNFHCNWTGISCSRKHRGRVVKLHLTESSLQGIISPHIGNLSFLHYLNLSSNAFTSSIPPAIGDLRNLRILDLTSNSFSGILPPQLGYLKNLQMLYAFSNELSGSIPSLHNCSKLTSIGLSNNNFSGNIPKDIGSLIHLTFVNLGNNSLSGNIEESIRNLSSLKVLHLSKNQFGGMVPSWIGELSKLKELYLDHNSLGGNIPRSLTNCTDLEYLDFSFNNLHGTIPSSLGMLPNIEEMYLNHNSLTGFIPDSLSNATKLRIIEISVNALQGIVPLSFGRLSSLECFSASKNRIESGITNSYQPIPILQSFYNCSKLDTIWLSDNKLQGSLPSMLPRQIERLYLHENRISGSIPASLGNLTNLSSLSLFSNNLIGFIPRTIGHLKSLQSLCLDDNLLGGTIPEEMCSLSKNLYEVNLSSNHLTGSIPKNIGQLSNLRRLYLGKNSFSGTIPHELGNCMLLEDLNLSFNNVSGKIPREVANLRHIQFAFDLSNNKLSGTIPPEIGGLQMALQVDLSNNQLSGQIFSYMDAWLNTEYINVSNNKFSGRLPDSFGTKKPGLKVLDISHNNFSGAVSPSLYNLSALRILNFSYNNFEGRISCDGSFKKLSHSSFFHNYLLCGKCMGLPNCLDVSAKHSQSHLYKARWFIIIVVVIGLLFFVSSCYLLFFKKQGRLAIEVPMTNHFKVLSKDELVIATNNMSEANLIGKGSYGSVYSGLLQSGDMVAVKIFNIENQQRSNASFVTECQTLGKLRHRNLMKISTVCCEQNFRAIILPLMVRGNLHDLLHGRDMEDLLTPITLEMHMDIISGLAGALSYLHHDCTPSIVHCDVKPENVLLDKDMTVKLTDFGIAKIMGTSLHSNTLSLRGSVGYVAPEYGVGGDVSSKGDVYSFGVVVLEMMTRKKPTDDMFSGDMSMLEWVSMALAEEGQRRSIVEIVNCSEEDMKRIEGVMRLGIACCHQDPSQRPTMREVEDLLNMFVGCDAAKRRVMPNLDDILASMHTNQNQPAPEHSFSSTF